MKNNLLFLTQKIGFLISYLTKNSFSETKLLKNIITDDSIVIDIGSNVGSYIDTINKINSKTKIYSIEPNEEILEFQKNKFMKNDNLEYFNFAIDNINGYRKFYFRSPTSHSSFFPSHQDKNFNNIIRSQHVKTVKLEDFIYDQKITKVKILKIDIEGLDFETLSSSKDLILKNKIEFIKIELNQDTFEKTISFANQVNLKFLGISKSFYYKNTLNFMDVYFENNNKTRN